MCRNMQICDIWGMTSITSSTQPVYSRSGSRSVTFQYYFRVLWTAFISSSFFFHIDHFRMFEIPSWNNQSVASVSLSKKCVISCGCSHNNTLCCHCCPNKIMFYYQVWSCISIISPLLLLPHVFCLRARTIHHLNQTKTPAKMLMLGRKAELDKAPRRSADFYCVMLTRTKHICHLSKWYCSSKGRSQVWVVTNQLRAEVSVRSSRGLQKRMVGAATCRKDEWWVCLWDCCLFFFSLPLLFSDSFFLSFRQSRSSFIGTQDRACGNIIHRSLYMVGKLISIAIIS